MGRAEYERYSVWHKLINSWRQPTRQTWTPDALSNKRKTFLCEPFWGGNLAPSQLPVGNICSRGALHWDAEKQNCKTEAKLKVCEEKVRGLTTVTKSDTKGNVVAWAVFVPDRTADKTTTLALIGATMMVLVPHSTQQDRADALVKILTDADSGRDSSILLGNYRWKAISNGRSVSVMATR